MRLAVTLHGRDAGIDQAGLQWYETKAVREIPAGRHKVKEETGEVYQL